jgi:centrosomal protein CEP290
VYSGEYGLSQAVQEIKDLKANLRLRDEKIEGLTSQVNQLGIAVNDTETENEELRERLGLDPKEPLDTDAIKEKKLVKTQQQAALNRVLSKEVCLLYFNPNIVRGKKVNLLCNW